ncbi:MAG TPA: ACT domain-containing protein, partial [Candidatus Sulfotelmatobacter sp.]|nr:ACT domain-containing protein [Candidatus Sulfotelmatobacter sp.]
VSDGLHSVRIEGADEPGLGAKLTGALAQAGINLRGISAAAIGSRMVCYLALDTSADAAKAVEGLKRF